MKTKDPPQNAVAERLSSFSPWVPGGSSSERCTACGRRVYASEMALTMHGAVLHSRCALFAGRSPSTRP